MSQEDIALDEKRIYGETRQTTDVYVASGVGLAHITVSGDQAGRISLDQRGTITDVAGGGGRLLVATPEDVLVGTDDGLAGTDFGPAVAVGVAADALVAAGPDGDVALLAGDEWTAVGSVDDPRALDGRYLAAADGVYRVADDDGVYRVADDDIVSLGLDDVRDVAADTAAGGPYAATGDRLYGRTADEWVVDRDGTAEAVAAGGGHAHVVAGNLLFERDGEGWRECSLPVESRVADVAYGEGVYAVTVDGTFLVEADPDTTPDGRGGWRHRSLGVPDVTAIAVP
jgi:hypothetical protein